MTFVLETPMHAYFIKVRYPYQGWRKVCRALSRERKAGLYEPNQSAKLSVATWVSR